jgi:hypothetical protein
VSGTSFSALFVMLALEMVLLALLNMLFALPTVLERFIYYRGAKMKL